MKNEHSLCCRSMSVIEAKGAGDLQRPYTQGSFHNKLQEFDELIKELTLQDVEATPEERRQMITGKAQLQVTLHHR